MEIEVPARGSCGRMGGGRRAGDERELSPSMKYGAVSAASIAVERSQQDWR
jgi:hypothetical protein